MNALIVSAFRAMRSVFAPGMLVIFVCSVGVAVGMLAGFVALTGGVLSIIAQHMQDQQAAHYLPWVGSLGASVLAWFLFPGIMPVAISFFDDRIAGAIERQDYPAIKQPAQSHFWHELLHDVKFALVAVLLNILVLPLYLLPVVNLFLFYLLNGYLLGREFFIMAARRHIPVQDADAMRRRHGRIILTAGIFLAFMATIPVINLFAPFWGVAVMVHLFHKLEKPPASQPAAPTMLL